MVHAVGVVEAQVGIELAFQSGVAGVEVARERWPPALVGDRLVQCLDVPPGLRPAGVDAGVAHLQRVNGLREVALDSLPLSLSIRSSFQPVAFSSEAG